MNRDKGTYEGVREKFDEFLEIQERRPVLQRTPPAQRPYTPDETMGSHIGKNVFIGIGVGIGVLILALAALSFYAAYRWEGVGYNGAWVGYIVTGFFLLLSGLGGIAATLNHNLRVLARPGGHH